MALRAKTESSIEIRGLAQAFRELATPVTIPGPILDIAGTGGDRTCAINISTLAAIVAAATGVTVVKHGGRSASSHSAGAADLVEQLGISLDLTATQAARIATEAGITFLFAPQFNPGLRHVRAVRRQLGVQTVFNILGPIINPADPAHQMVGVADEKVVPVVAQALAERGRRALVVRGDDGLDKLTTTTTSQLYCVHDATITRITLDPRELGLPRAEPGAFRGGNPSDNARITREFLDGRRGPIRDIVLLNAAAALTILTPASNSFIEQLAIQYRRCSDAVDSSAAANKLQHWITVSQNCLPQRGDAATCGT